MEKELDVQFVGYGNMWSSLGKILQEKAEKLGISLKLSIDTRSSHIISRTAEVIFACVKPKQINDISLDVYDSSAVCVSIMNGIRTEKFGRFQNVVRTMPNLLGEVWEGITAWYEKWHIADGLKYLLQEVFTESWIIIHVDNEIDFSAFTAFAWCWPAIVSYIEDNCHNDVYRAYVYECMQHVGERLWFNQEQSSVIVQKLRSGVPKYIAKHNITYADFIHRVSAWDSSSSTYHIVDSFVKNNLDRLLEEEIESIEDVLFAWIRAGKIQSDKLSEQYSK